MTEITFGRLAAFIAQTIIGTLPVFLIFEGSKIRRFLRTKWNEYNNGGANE